MKDILQRSTPSDGFNQINPHRPIKRKKETQNKQTNSGKKSKVYTCVAWV
jgi:hypothetical protein